MVTARQRIGWLVLALVAACGGDAAANTPAMTAASAATAGASGLAPSVSAVAGRSALPEAGRSLAAGSGGASGASGAAGSSTTVAAGSGAAGSLAGNAAAGTLGSAGMMGTAGSAGAAGSGTTSAPLLPPVTSTREDGPFQAMEDDDLRPTMRAGVFRPSELGKAGQKHPVFIWGCGGSSTPAQYADQLLRIATHGFIVVAEVAEIGDDGAPLTRAIDWILAENDRADSPYHDVVAKDRVAVGGHSIGSANAFFIANDPRLTTSIHVAGGSLDDVNDPFAATTGMGGKRLIHPVAYICSMSDTFGNVEKTEKDYDNTSVPAWMTVMTGVDHVAAARSGLPATIAWLRWHLAGESDRRSAFLEDGGEFTSGMFVSRNKNW